MLEQLLTSWNEADVGNKTAAFFSNRRVGTILNVAKNGHG
jgi:hypothetical protein